MQSTVAIYQEANGEKIRRKPGIPEDYDELWGKVDDLYCSSLRLFPPTKELDLNTIATTLLDMQWTLLEVANCYGINMAPAWHAFLQSKLSEDPKLHPVL